ELSDEVGACVAAAIPDVGDGDDLAIPRRRDGAESRDQRLHCAFGKTDDADADAVVGSEDAGVTRRIPVDCADGGAGGDSLDEVATRIGDLSHGDYFLFQPNSGPRTPNCFGGRPG